MPDTPTPSQSRASIPVSAADAHRLAEALRAMSNGAYVRHGSLEAVIAALSSAVPAGPAGEGGDVVVWLERWRDRHDRFNSGEVEHARYELMADVVDDYRRTFATSPQQPAEGAEGARVSVNDVVRDATGEGVITHVVTAGATPGPLVVVVDRWDPTPQQSAEAAGEGGER